MRSAKKLWAKITEQIHSSVMRDALEMALRAYGADEKIVEQFHKKVRRAHIESGESFAHAANRLFDALREQLIRQGEITMRRPTCETCVYCVHAECRRYAPLPYHINKEAWSSAMGYFYEDVLPESWCGEHHMFPEYLASLKIEGRNKCSQG